MSWPRRFALHLAAAVGATGIFVAAAAVGAHQQQARAVAGAIPITRTARPLGSPTPGIAVSPRGTRQPTATADPAQQPTPAPRQERSLSGVVRAVEPDGLVVATAAGRVWRVQPVPGALVRLDGKSAHLDTMQPGDRVVVLGVAESRDRFLAHAVTARRQK